MPPSLLIHVFSLYFPHTSNIALLPFLIVPVTNQQTCKQYSPSSFFIVTITSKQAALLLFSWCLQVGVSSNCIRQQQNMQSRMQFHESTCLYLSMNNPTTSSAIYRTDRKQVQLQPLSAALAYNVRKWHTNFSSLKPSCQQQAPITYTSYHSHKPLLHVNSGILFHHPTCRAIILFYFSTKACTLRNIDILSHQ